MITINVATTSDSSTIASLWNSMAEMAESCWYQAVEMTRQSIEALLEAGMVFVVAHDGESAVGFGFWRPAAEGLRLHALAGQSVEAYYRLMVAYADWGLANDFASGWCEISPRETREMGWMNALAAVEVRPVGREPLVEGADPALRSIEWLRVTASLAGLRQAALDELEG